MFTFTVSGTPKPQGSKVIRTYAGKSWMFEANDEVYSWRDKIRSAATLAKNIAGLGVIMEHAVFVELTFVFKRPKSAPKSRTWPSVKPDADKLARAVLDALTDVLYKDDGQVVDLHVRKTYAHEGFPEGVIISVAAYDNSLITTPIDHKIAQDSMQY